VLVTFVAASEVDQTNPRLPSVAPEDTLDLLLVVHL